MRSKAMCVIAISVLMAAPLMSQSRPYSGTTARLEKAYGRLPLSFEANRGQTNRQVEFLSRGPGYTLFLTRSGEAVRIGGAVDLTPRAASPDADGACLRVDLDLVDRREIDHDAAVARAEAGAVVAASPNRQE